MLEIQNDTDGHRALRLYISKIFQRVVFYFFLVPSVTGLKCVPLTTSGARFLKVSIT